MNTKAILPWLKSHWPIPTLTLVALAALPTAWFFAEGMRKEHIDKFSADVTKDFTSISENTAKVSYSIPSVDGAGKLLEKSAPANEAMIVRYGDVWTQVQSKVGAVSERGSSFNKADHAPLITDYFPKPADESSASLTVKGRQFVGEYIKAHQAILNKARAGMPPKADELARRLAQHAADAEAKIRAETGREPAAEEKQKLAKELLEMRLGAYQAKARDIGVYADVSVFEGVPAEVPDKAPGLAEAYDKQERLWINSDIFRAVAKANGDSAGGVSDSVVKRVTKIDIEESKWDSTSGTPPVSSYEPGEDKVALNFGKSITGRVSGPGSKNKWYDVRTVKLDVIISSQRIPEFIDALAATNFMTVLDIDLFKIDPMVDLRDGFTYGPDNVVRAEMMIETVWLREWRKAYMPVDVQKALGMVEGVVGADAAGGGGAAPPQRGGGRKPPAGDGAAPAAGGGKRGGRDRDDPG